MKPYIKTVADNLIDKRLADDIWERLHKDQEKLLRRIMDELVTPISLMEPSKMGRIICSFVSDDITPGTKEIFAQVHSDKIGEPMLRELVSISLSHVIRDRMNQKRRYDPDIYKTKVAQ